MAQDAVQARLVVVGSSAGGIDALSILVGSLPADFPAPIVIAQHLDPQHFSHLDEILAARATAPVHTILDHETLQPGHIYVVPADRHVLIANGHLSLLEDHVGRPKPSINLLFTTAAEEYGEGLIAVILTGTGSDGAAGAQEVKRAGGAVIVQNPATAAFPSMPRSLAPTTVDFVANIGEIGALLYDLLVNRTDMARPSEAKALQSFLQQIHDRSGLDFTAYKAPTIQRRLQRRMVATGSSTLATYRRYLQHHPEENARLISSFLIKVTEFFRDGDLFQALREVALPELIREARQNGNELRIWSAGCATGEEAYSLAILVAELLGDELNQFNVRIFATDLDNDAIGFARRGVYPASSLRNLPPELALRYFTRLDGDYEVQKRIRTLMVFGQHDLGQRAPFPRIDLILCRNVLIYFTVELQKRALQLFAYSLRDQGFLALGKAETISPLEDYFTTVNSSLKLYRRQGERMPIPVAQLRDTLPYRPILLTASVSNLALAPTREASRARSSMEKLGNLVFNLPIGVVVVDRRYDVQIINSLAHQLLEIHRSAIGEDLLHLAEQVPTKQLRAVIDAALNGETPPPATGEFSIESETGTTRYLQILGYPRQFEGDEGFFASVLLIINDVTEQTTQRLEQQAVQDAREQTAHEQVSPPTAAELATNVGMANVAIQRLEAENQRLTTQAQQLMLANRELRDANRDLTATNIELHQANEEYLINAEEAQAASEEVETLNEELQATNEELETLNEELQATVEELNTTNDDLEARSNELHDLVEQREEQRRTSDGARSQLEAILSGMGDAVLVMDAASQPLLVNRAYGEMFGDERVSPPFADESGALLPADALPRARAARGETFTITFTLPTAEVAAASFGETRRWYEASGRPIEVGGAPHGGVVVIRDISERSLRRLQDEFLALASHELRTPLTAAQAALQMADRRLTAMARAERAQREDAEATGDTRTSGQHDAEQPAADVTPVTARRSGPLVTTATDGANAPTGATADFLRAQVELSLRQVRHLGTLIGDLMDVGRLQTGKLRLKMQPVDLTEVVRQATQTVQITVPHHTIALTAPAEPLMMEGDAIRLEQIVFNLLTDAVNYAPQSERIDVRLRRQRDHAELQVQDHGPGIAADKLPHLFTRFYQVERHAGPSARRQEGLGVGLFIMRELAVAHGGDIAVISQEGAGTTFTVTLPLLGD